MITKESIFNALDAMDIDDALNSFEDSEPSTLRNPFLDLAPESLDRVCVATVEGVLEEPLYLFYSSEMMMLRALTVSQMKAWRLVLFL